jgi:hypothetical protein
MLAPKADVSVISYSPMHANRFGQSLPVVTKTCAGQVECKRLVRTGAIDWSVAMQSGGQVHAITQQLSYWPFPPKSGHQLPVKLTPKLRSETPLVSRISTPSVDALAVVFEDDGLGCDGFNLSDALDSKKSQSYITTLHPL